MLAYLQKRWFLILTVLGIAMAVQVPGPTRALFSGVETRHVAASALFFMSIGLATNHLWDSLRSPGPSLLALAMTWGLAPPLGYLGSLWLLPEKFGIGLIIACCAPCTLASAAVWTGMGGGNQAIALLITMITNSFVFIGTAGWLTLLTGRGIDVDAYRLIGELVLYVVVPIFIAQGLRFVGPIARTVDMHKPTIKILCQAFILLMIIKSAVQTNTALAERAAQGLGGETWSAFELVHVALVCGGVHIVILVTGYFLGTTFFGRSDGVAVAIAGSQKTLPVAALIANEFFAHVPLAIVPILFYHVGQLMIDTYFVEIIQRSPPEEPDVTDAVVTG